MRLNCCPPFLFLVKSSASGVLLGGASLPPLEQPSLPTLASTSTHSAATTGNGSSGAGSEGEASRGGSGVGADVQEARGVGVGAGGEAIPVTADSGPADLSLPSPGFKTQKKASGQVRLQTRVSGVASLTSALCALAADPFPAASWSLASKTSPPGRGKNGH